MKIKTDIKISFFYLLIIIGLTACTNTAETKPTLSPVFTPQSATPYITPSRTITSTVTKATTLTPVATLTPIPLETIIPTPTDQSDCTNVGRFIDDVTIPDNTNLKKEEAFNKTWRVRNVGTCTWNERYLFVFWKGSQMSASGSSKMGETAPGKMTDISIEMIAPKTDGVFMGVYQFQDPNGNRFGLVDGNLWVKIVAGSGTSIPSQTPTKVAIQTPNFANKTPITTPIITPTENPTKVGMSGQCTYTQNTNFESQVLTLINLARSENGLPPFTLNNQLSQSALSHSIDMGCNNFLRHSGSDGSSVKTRVTAQGYSASSVQEGIYAQPVQYGGSPKSAVDWWLNDAIHRAILLNTTLTEIGVGYVDVPTSYLGGYYTIDVATP